MPTALSIAGSDSGGGAGIQADLKTFFELGVHGTNAITCITAQNPKQILDLCPCEPHLVIAQLRAVFEELPPQAMKTGMLYSGEIIRAVVKFLTEQKHRPPLVVDPVLVATSGSRLLEPKAMEMLKRELLPLATLVTPNLAETEVLTGRVIRGPEDMRGAARWIQQTFGCAGLIKGGHLEASRDAVDIYYDGQNELLLTAPFIKGLSLHGTGCTYSAAITGFLALGCKLPEAVQRAKGYISSAIAGSASVGGHSVLGWSTGER